MRLGRQIANDNKNSQSLIVRCHPSNLGSLGGDCYSEYTGTCPAALTTGGTPVTYHTLARPLFGFVVLLGVLTAASPAWCQSGRDPNNAIRSISALNWQRGPTEARIGSVAAITVPEAQLFLDASNTRRFLKLTGNPPRDNRYTLAADDLSWFAIFFFNDSGYVKDDEKLDAASLLRSLKEADKSGNEERQRLGMSPLYTEGWHVPPHYDNATKRLEWGVRLRTDDGDSLINYTIRILGRRGVMHAVLVSDLESLDKDIAVFKASLTGYDFSPGERYAEFRAGDRVAEYGLAALVLGGAAVVATKSGFGKALGKFAIFGLLALGSGVVAFFRKLSGKG